MGKLGQKRGRINGTGSPTRSASLKGKPSQRKGKRSVRRCSQQNALPPRPPQPKPDPTLKPLPLDRLFVSALPVLKAARLHRIGDLKTCRCFDCGAQLAISFKTEIRALADPLRDGRPLEFIGHECCLPKYGQWVAR